MLMVDQVTKKFGDFTALEDITIEFDRGVYALLAPNGAGKTTLIKMLTTLIFPSAGEILWNGDEITRLDERYREVVGYLPQEFGYYKNHTPREFLGYLAALKGLDRKAAAKRTDELLELVSLTEVRDKKMRAFSGGMIQRVGIAQALQNDPQILILDEPTAGLDPKERVRFHNLISSLSKDRIVIMSTHIVADIETIADRVIMFKDHKLLRNASPSEICQNFTGKVYETSNATVLDETQLLLTERNDNGQAIVRFACYGDSAVPESYPVTPNLEDVFLCIYSDDGFGA